MHLFWQCASCQLYAFFTNVYFVRYMSVSLLSFYWYENQDFNFYYRSQQRYWCSVLQEPDSKRKCPNNCLMQKSRDLSGAFGIEKISSWQLAYIACGCHQRGWHCKSSNWSGWKVREMNDSYQFKKSVNITLTIESLAPTWQLLPVKGLTIIPHSLQPLVMSWLPPLQEDSMAFQTYWNCKNYFLNWLLGHKWNDCFLTTKEMVI